MTLPQMRRYKDKDGPRAMDVRKTRRMARCYFSGLSLAQVGEKFGLSRQTIFTRFSRAGIKMRSTQLLPAIEFNGFSYTRKPSGYYAKTCGERTLLHRDVWEFHNGKIPSGHDIHHRNHDRSDNHIDNLWLMTKADHTRLHHKLKITQHQP